MIFHNNQLFYLPGQSGPDGSSSANTEGLIRSSAYNGGNAPSQTWTRAFRPDGVVAYPSAFGVGNFVYYTRGWTGPQLVRIPVSPFSNPAQTNFSLPPTANIGSRILIVPATE